MFLNKMKTTVCIALCLGLFAVLIGGALAPRVVAQDSGTVLLAKKLDILKEGESDEKFLRRVSLDLRGKEPTPTEIHFFLASKDANKRQKVIDLFIQERQAAKGAKKLKVLEGKIVDLDALIVKEHSDLNKFWRDAVVKIDTLPRFNTIQADFYKEVLAATKEKKEVAAITQNYLDRLMKYVKEHPKNTDVPEAILHISLVYRAQGKTVEADAWRTKLLKEHPNSPAAQTANTGTSTDIELFFHLARPMGPKEKAK